MIDMIEDSGGDIQVIDTQSPRAANILSIQLGYLEYAQELGIDLEYFLNPDFVFQTESFKSYLIDRLAQSGISVNTVTTLVENLSSRFTMDIPANAAQEGFIT